MRHWLSPWLDKPAYDMGNEIILKRRHRAAALRGPQLELNTLAAKGGRRYIDRRLWRAPNESDISWFGTYTPNTGKAAAEPDPGTVGRKDRAALVNDAGRVVAKITQYLFKNEAARPGIDEAWAANVTGTGKGISSFWVDASETLTASQWLWVSVDRQAPLKDEAGNPRLRTLLEKARDRDVIKWTLWPANAVPDWSFSEDGDLLWILTEEHRYENADPMAEAQCYPVRTLWRRDPAAGNAVSVQQFRIRDGQAESLGDPQRIPGLDRIPFALIGTPSCDPWWFDDVEALQAQLLNIDSLHIENLVRAVFPQLVIPESCLANMEARIIERTGVADGQQTMRVIRELLRGLDAPIVESGADSGTTRYIQPNAGDLKALPDEINRKRGLLFDMVGLSLFNRESRQIASAESKQFDQLDTESTLKHRARVLQAAEEELVAISQKVDPLFKTYAPAWPTSFDVVDTAADSQALTLLGNLPDTPPAMRKMVLLGALRILAEVSGYDKDMLEVARQEIDAMDFTAEAPPAAPGAVDVAPAAAQ